MMDRYLRRLNDWLSSGKALCVSLLTICILAGPQARAACPLVAPSGVEMTLEVRAIVGSTWRGATCATWIRSNIPSGLMM